MDQHDADTAAIVDRARDHLAHLVGFPTVSRTPNLDLMAWAAGLLESRGIRAEVLPGPEGDRANLFATIGPEGPGGIVLSGHTDVVPADPADWTSPPFTLTERGGRLYGRGTADMKSFVALALAMVPEIRRRPLRRPFHLCFSYDEEVGCFGAQLLVEHLRRRAPDAGLVIVGEPTSLHPVAAHKGIDVFRTTVTGQDAHSSLPTEGTSAIRGSAEVVRAIYAVADGRAAVPVADSPFDPPYSTLNVGTIDGGTALNVIARDCTIVWETRTLPEDPADRVLADVERHGDAMARPLLAVHAGCGIATERLVSVPGQRPDPDGMAETVVRQITGRNAGGTVPFATEAGLFQDAGFSTVVIGPGDIAQAHQPDESIGLDDLAAGAAFLGRLADWACNQPT